MRRELTRRAAFVLRRFAEELSQPRDAVMWASAFARGRGWILVTGSFRIVGEIRSIIRELEARQRADSRAVAVLQLSRFHKNRQK